MKNNKKRVEIQKITGVSRPTINKYIKEDPRYLEEVAYRLLEAKNRRKNSGKIINVKEEKKQKENCGMRLMKL